MLFEDRYTMIVDRDHGDVGDTISLAQYEAMGHVAFQGGPADLPPFETWFSGQYGDKRRVEVAASSFHLLPLLVIGTKRIATVHSRLVAQYLTHLPVRPVRPLFEIPRLVEVLQWHQYRDQDPGSVWLRDRIVAAAQALPPPEALY